MVGPTKESEQLVARVRKPRSGELQPLVCKGWWEQQCFILYGLSTTSEPTELIEKYGGDTVKSLWECVPRETVGWLSGLDFGFFDLDCLLIHGSTVSVSEELTPNTEPIKMLDRLSRMEANNFFCGRSGLTFQYLLEAGSVTSGITTLDNTVSPQTLNIVNPRQVIGVGNVGRKSGEATYTIYNPNANQVEFKTVRYGISKGFGVAKSKAIAT
ncbi:MAG: metallophosphatase [Methylacidiphilales bacterium]|nr:metallophosphatase [Candidatus Methylacidiphilales bacterium]